ncbi:23S rRNA (pseudouridine(1915)-N(3))-methyltransferase RlmH [bacterium]|nr:23S rRNA (pseudouridine(1915)-N(3))-methyltransferase RlmH [bacterium]MBU1072092.1 23S rRNA (pseudouridine(1915)-N(3))-methyltransferase RlmH [bacterium]MBU1676165.1 23S rRNA (pseudouridine(1915)-N(3))-methyltransferase RlmH [bacterium]
MIRLLAVGRMKDPHLAELCADFAQRIGRWSALEIIELKDQDPDREAAAMLQKLGTGPVHALDERGDPMSSREFSSVLASHGSPTFLIGGPDGLGGAARKRADRILSLSPLTFTHETARYLLLEQIYRGLAIGRNHPYHRA